MALSMRFSALAVVVPLLALGLSGCLSGEEEEEDGGSTRTVTVWTPKWQNESFTGEIPGSNPALLNPLETCKVQNEGEEDLQTKRHKFTPENATVSARLELSFTAAGPTTMTPVYNYPDMDLLLLDPNGNEISACEAAMGGNPEVLKLNLTLPGEYTALVVNFASVQNQYELKVSLRYKLEETVEVEEEAPAADGNETA